MDAILKNMERVKNKIIILSGKGGVGKSTVSAMIARALSADSNTEVCRSKMLIYQSVNSINEMTLLCF